MHFFRNKKGFTLLEVLAAVLIIAVLTTVAWRVFDRFVERSRASDAENTIGLAAYAQNRQLMRKGRYTLLWTALDAAPLATYMDKTGDYINEEGTIFLNKGGGLENPRGGFKMYFEDIGDVFFLVADRINWRYTYTLVRPLKSTTTYCVPAAGSGVDANFCEDFMGVESEEDIPEDPRLSARQALVKEEESEEEGSY